MSALKVAPPLAASAVAPGSSRKFGVFAGTPGRRPPAVGGLVGETPLQTSSLANASVARPVAFEAPGLLLSASRAAPPAEASLHALHWVQLFGVPPGASDALLARLCARCGPIGGTAPCRQALSLLVGFADRAGADAAAALDGEELGGPGDADACVLGARLVPPPPPSVTIVRGAGGGGEGARGGLPCALLVNLSAAPAALPTGRPPLPLPLLPRGPPCPPRRPSRDGLPRACCRLRGRHPPWLAPLPPTMRLLLPPPWLRPLPEL